MALGVIVAPYGPATPGSFYAEVLRSKGAGGTYLAPYDPYYNQRGEVGWYHDTQLGRASIAYRVGEKLGFLKRWWLKRKLGLRDFPTDSDLAITRGYSPTTHGWIEAKEGFINRVWYPPDGWDPANGFAPPNTLQGLGAEAQAVTPVTAGDMIATLNQHQSRMFTLSVISTVAVAISALFATYRTARLLHRDAQAVRRDIRRRARGTAE